LQSHTVPAAGLWARLGRLSRILARDLYEVTDTAVPAEFDEVVRRSVETTLYRQRVQDASRCSASEIVPFPLKIPRKAVRWWVSGDRKSLSLI
jgi:hypothetical protein